MSETVVGRDREQAVIAEFLDGVDAWPWALVLDGVPGIGKTSLWEAALAAARARSYRLLVCRPTGVEAQLSFAALADLLADMPTKALPDPQRRALDAALQLAEPTLPSPGPLALPLGVLGILRSAANDGPLVVAVDDAQWLDRPTATVLAYAWRRLRDEPIAVLATTRRESEAGAPWLDESLVGGGATRIEVGPLTIGALQRLLRLRLGRSMGRQALVRLHRATGGNPLYALEVARAATGTSPAPGTEPSMPSTLREVVGRRVRELPPRAREVLLAAAVLADPTAGTLSAAFPRANVAASLREGAAAGVVVRDGERIRFTHPLLAAAIHSDTSPDALKDVHRRLAGVVEHAEERARHLALGAEGPDESVASALDEAAARAAARGAPAVAAELLELAIALTIDGADEDRRHRTIAAGRHHLEAGDAAQARVLLEQVLDELSAGRERADVILLALETFDEDAEQAVVLELCGRALADAGDDHRRASAIHTFLARYWSFCGENGRALASARTAYALAEQSTDPSARFISATHLAREEIRAGRRTRGLLDRALALEVGAAHRVLDSPRLALAHLRLFQGRLIEARTLCETLLGEAETRGEEPSAAGLHDVLGYIACRTCDFASAEERVVACREIAARIYDDDSPAMAQHMILSALVDAHLGRVDHARAVAERAAAIAERAHAAFVARRCRAVIGFVELSTGNMRDAALVLTPVVEQLVARGYAIAPHPVSIDPLEALIAVGDLERARPLVARYLAEARRLGSPMLRAMGERCRGLLASADGDPAAARAALERALAAQREGGWEFALARTLLASGHVERRAKQKRAARESFAAALAIFDRLGTRAWSDQTCRQLGRIGGRPPASTELTPAEERVATLVAAGRTNSETAAQLHLSEHTVEGHLTRIYTKLGVHSRTQLTRRLLSE